MERVRLRQQEEFPCPATAKLNNNVAFNMLPLAGNQRGWTTKASWVSKFLAFATQISRQAGKFKTDQQLLASDNMCRHFIQHVADEMKGPTRARSARAALTSQRLRLGFVSLSGNADISAVVKAAEAQEPRTKKKAAGLTALMLRFLVKKWGKHRRWWQRQCATIFSLGFVSLMRLGEIITLLRKGVRVTYRDGSEEDLCKCRVLPPVNAIAGLLLHLPWRKNHVTQDCWIPVACPTVISLLLRQVHTLRARQSPSKYLFPSRQYRKGNREEMNPTNHVGHGSLITALRNALLDTVPTMTKAWAKLYSGHSLRVGGSNEMRRRGVADEVHRKLGGWMSLVSAQGYMSLSAREQFRYSLRLAKKKKRRSGLATQRAARAALTQLRVTIH